jgi:hypothetical protein
MQLVTFSSKPIESTPLYESNEKYGYDLINLAEKDIWHSNGYKLFLLHQYLAKVPANLMICVIDAFDIELFASPDQMTKAFKDFECDILFSTEANFYFSNRSLYTKYLLRYPNKETYYRFLNSGTYMGEAGKLLRYLEDAMMQNGLSMDDEESFKSLVSDQYILSKHFVDIQDLPNYPLTIKLDYEQKLFGCAGGRTMSRGLKLLSKKHSFYFYRTERKLLKRSKAVAAQYKFRDLKMLDAKTPYNEYTGHSPLLVHFPGSKEHFKIKMDFLKYHRVPSEVRALNRQTRKIVFLAYLVSIFKTLFFRY